MPSDPRDYKLDLSKDKQAGGFSPGSKTKPCSDARPYLQALFACCNVYQRIYRSANGKRYDGACPRCGKKVRFVVGTGGTTSRSFVVE
jgi:hypothetical protein